MTLTMRRVIVPKTSQSAVTATRGANRARRHAIATRADSNNENRYGACWPGRAEVPPNVAPLGNGNVKRISLLGSTGSIGTQTLDICEEHPDKFEVVALSAGRNVQLVAEQCKKFSPKLVSVQNGEDVDKLKSALQGLGAEMPEIMYGADGIVEVARHADCDSVVTGIVGCAGLPPTVAAIEAGKNICLANKETLIAGGPAIVPLAVKHGVKILPADSEHSALFQCIQGMPEGALRRIILTASGGAFRDMELSTMKELAISDPTALHKKATTHPNWDMGAKITCDSATLMNKALESSKRTTSTARRTITSMSSFTRNRSFTRWSRPPTALCWRSWAGRTCACRFFTLCPGRTASSAPKSLGHDSTLSRWAILPSARRTLRSTRHSPWATPPVASVVR